MKHKQLIWGIFAFFGILILILDSKTALAGAQEGIVLCIKTAIPSLFPFFVLSNLLTGSLYGIRFAILRPFAKLLSIPAGCEILLISGFLGGYPTGAQAIMQAYQGKQLSKPEAERLLAYGSNAGPSFLFGITAQFFPETWMVWALWMIHVLSAVLTAQQFSFHTSSAALSIQRKEMTISAALKNALRAMELVCGWIVFFRSLIYIFRKWLLWMLPESVQVFVTGILELTNGCIELNTISGTSERFILCSCLLAFGGVCVLLQTAAVTQGLSLRYYFTGKLWQTLFSLILSCCLMYGLRFPALILFVLILLQKRKKSGSIPGTVGV